MSLKESKLACEEIIDVMDLIFTLRMPSPMWINIAPEKSFQSIRSLSTQPSSQSHTRLIHFLTIDNDNCEFVRYLFKSLSTRFSARLIIDLINLLSRLSTEKNSSRDYLNALIRALVVD